MGGLGTAALGTTALGLGIGTASGALYTQSVLTKSTTGAVSSVEIDPRTRDTVIDSSGSEEAMGDSAQRVYLLCKTTLGSRANFQTMGFAQPEKCGSDFSRTVEEAFTQALAPAVDDGSIRVDSIETETDATQPTRGYALVRWFDLRRQSQQTTKYPLQF